MSRVDSLDYLKGVGCILMIPAHTLLIDLDDKGTYYIYATVHFFACLFFAASGVTTLYQADQRPKPYLFMYFLVLFFVGLTYTSVFSPLWLFDFRLEIVQIIMLGCMSLLLMRHIFGNRWNLYLAVAMAIFLVKVASDRWFPGWRGAGVLFPHMDYVPWHLRPEGTPGVAVGFPVFPWLYLFPLGVYCFFAPLKWVWLISGIALVAVLGMLYQYGVGGFNAKWNMSIEHFLTITFITCFSFVIVRSVPLEKLPLQKIAVYWGRSSLTFLYVHLIVINLAGVILAIVGSKETPFAQYIWYTVSYIGTYYAMKWVMGLRSSTWMQKESSWIILLLVVFTMPVLAYFTPQLKMLVSVSGLLIGLFMAHNYRAIKDFPSLKKLLPTHEEVKPEET